MKKAQISLIWIIAIVVTVIMTFATLNAIIDPSLSEQKQEEMFNFVVMGLVIAFFAVLGYALFMIPGALLGVTVGWFVGTVIVKIIQYFGGIS